MSSGPKYPPITPIELMNASPEAAPTPVIKRVGVVQNAARADVMPIRAMVRPTSPMARESDSTDTTRPTAPSPQVIVRLLIFLPLLSTTSAHQIMAAVANA